jgi:hypothetical protein
VESISFMKRWGVPVHDKRHPVYALKRMDKGKKKVAYYMYYFGKGGNDGKWVVSSGNDGESSGTGGGVPCFVSTGVAHTPQVAGNWLWLSVGGTYSSAGGAHDRSWDPSHFQVKCPSSCVPSTTPTQAPTKFSPPTQTPSPAPTPLRYCSAIADELHHRLQQDKQMHSQYRNTIIWDDKEQLHCCGKWVVIGM